MEVAALDPANPRKHKNGLTMNRPEFSAGLMLAIRHSNRKRRRNASYISGPHSRHRPKLIASASTNRCVRMSANGENAIAEIIGAETGQMEKRLRSEIAELRSEIDPSRKQLDDLRTADTNVLRLPTPPWGRSISA